MRKLPVLLIIFTLIMASACKDKKVSHDNPLLAEWDTPFGMPPFNEIKASHFKPAFEEAMQMHNAEIDSIATNSAAPDFENTILALDNAGEMYSRISRVFSNLCSAEMDDDLKAVQEEMSPILTKHSGDIYLNTELFDRVAEVYAKRGSSGLDSLQQRLTEKTYERFTRAGALLGEQGKQALREIDEKLSLAQIRFGNNILEANNSFRMVLDSADVEGLPSLTREAAAALATKEGHKNKFVFTLSKPSMLPFLTNSPRRALREKLYKGYLDRCNYNTNDNREIINEIVSLRTQRAKLLGFDTHADYMLADRMAEDPAAVYALLDELWTPALDRAKVELEDMRELKKREDGDPDFQSWDWWYYAEKVRKEKYSIDEEMLRPYFSLPAVRRGIFELCNKLYGLTFRPVSNIPVYNPECEVFEVLDIDNKHLGILLLDYYPRDTKKVGAWCSSYRSRSYKNGERIDPIVTIVCNFTRPSESSTRPALLLLDEVETFFHEFGHAVHSLFTDVPYKGLGRTERDFVELPSQIMENWAFEPALLRRYALHYSSDVAIPENLLEKIVSSQYFNQGFATTEYLAASYSDMDIHTIPDYSPIDINAFEARVLGEQRGLIPEIAPRHRYPYFSHIFNGGYSAGYYSYIWAEVLDKDAYEAFTETGDLFNRNVAQKFRKEVLEKGGAADGMTLYRNFRGKDPSGDFLLYARGLKERPAPEPGDESGTLPVDSLLTERPAPAGDTDGQ